MIPKSLNKGELKSGKTIEYKILVVNDQKTWRNRVMKNIQKPYIGIGFTQEEAQNELEEKKAAMDFALAIIDNDSGEGLNTLDAVKEFDPDIPVIYTSMMPDDPKWLSRPQIQKWGAHVHHTRDTASEKVNELLAKYIGET